MNLLSITWLGVLLVSTLAFFQRGEGAPRKGRLFLRGIAIQAWVGLAVAWMPFWARANPISLEALRHGFVFAGGRAAFGVLQLLGPPEGDSSLVWILPVGGSIVLFALLYSGLRARIPEHPRRVQLGFTAAALLHGIWGLHFLRNVPVG